MKHESYSGAGEGVNQTNRYKKHMEIYLFDIENTLQGKANRTDSHVLQAVRFIWQFGMKYAE